MRFVRCFVSAASLAFVLACDPALPAVDAGADTSGADAGRCTTATDCDDGLFCNGVETCTDGVCGPGVNVLCDDGIDCTADACSEDLRACASRPPDADRDGASDAACLDAGGTPLGTDCDDADADRFPGNLERCDAALHDEDCSAETHGGGDADGDGFHDARCCNGTSCGDDCNDANAGIHPDAIEVCNLVDDDCNGAADEGVATEGFVDADHDGYGDGSMPMSACGTASGFSPYGTDCDDHDVARSPGQAEFCDTLDNDCDTNVDEGASNVQWFLDADSDGFGAATSGTTSSCTPPAGYSLLGTDCNDAVASVSPGAAEVCNAIDDDCNGIADYRISAGDLEDDDRDGVADAACGAPIGVDCDDLDAASAPASAESCDGRDNDCDARVDEGATSVAFFRDADGDGYGADTALVVGCVQPTGYSRRGGDCDDTTTARRPGAPELCDGADEDCDLAIDEGEASAMCSLPGALAVCVAGTCSIGACAPGFADCSSGAGCETDILTDAAHCGSCSGVCDVTSSCSAGRCGPRFGSLQRLETASTGDEGIRRIAPVPGSNDVIVVGGFRGTVTLGSTLGSTVLTSSGGLDGFAARVRPNGSVMWAARWGDVLDDDLTALAIEPTTGALVVGGYLCGVQSLCGGPIGVAGRCMGFFQRMTVAGSACTYATVLDGETRVTSLAMERVSGAFHVYAGGSVLGTSAALGISSSYGDWDGYVAGFLETVGTTREWVRAAGSIYVDDVADIALDGAGRVVAVGTSGGSINFGAGPQAFAGFSDAYWFTTNTSTGALIAGKLFGSGGGYDYGTAVVLDGTTAYVIGNYGGTLVAGPGGIVTSSGGQDGYVAAFDFTTSATRWATSVGGTLGDALTRGAMIDGELVVTGSFSDTIPFASTSFSAWASTDGIVMGIAPTTGTQRWARQAMGDGTDVSTAVARRDDGAIVFATNYTSSLNVLGAGVVTTAGQGAALATIER